MPDTFQPALMTIQDFSRWSRMGRTKIYEEIGEARLPALKIGRRTYIRTVDAQAWLDRYVKAEAVSTSRLWSAGTSAVEIR